MIAHAGDISQSPAIRFPFNPYRAYTTDELLRDQEEWRWSLAEVRADAETMEPDVFAISEAYCLDRLTLIEEDVARRERLRNRPEAPAWPAVNDQRDELDRIKAAIRIEDLIHRYAPVQFRKAGTRLVCRCPLPGHDDDSPSFFIYPDQGRWHCFGCGRGGDVFEFVRQFNQIGEFHRAVDLAATMGGVERSTPARPPAASSPAFAAFEYVGGRVQP